MSIQFAVRIELPVNPDPKFFLGYGSWEPRLSCWARSFFRIGVSCRMPTPPADSTCVYPFFRLALIKLWASILGKFFKRWFYDRISQQS